MIKSREKVVYIDDYAHHPAELEAAISAARMLYPNRKLTGVFQPHLYSRTNDFSTAFAAALDQLDRCILLDIYPARELPMPGVSSELIFSQMKLKSKELCAKSEAIDVLKTDLNGCILTMGAGDIDLLVPQIKRMIKKVEK